MARELARRSLCTRDQVGALIVDAVGKVIGEGYNGPPAGFQHYDAPCHNWCNRSTASRIDLARDYADCPALHAEANALLTSDRTLRVGGSIYVTSHVCEACAKLVANSGLTRLVVAPTKIFVHRQSDRWYDFIRECGLEVVVIPHAVQLEDEDE